MLVDFNSNKVIENNELKTHIAHKYPYKDWIDQYKIDLELDEVQYQRQLLDEATLFKVQKQFGYTKEDIHKYMTDLVVGKKILLVQWGMMHRSQYSMKDRNHYLTILNNCLLK